MKSPFITIVLLFFIFSIHSSFSQHYFISGLTHDVNHQPVAFANVVIHSADEAEIINVSSTDELGVFKIEHIKSGNYVLKISFIGFDPISKPFSLLEDTHFGNITLVESTQTLDEVNIFAAKPTVKRLADRLIFNVANTALTEGNILDVLRNTPMVLIAGDKIEVKRITPTIYINDRKINLSGEEISQLLQNTPAHNIRSIEVITTPGAKYDASTGAVLNIVMDKNLIFGYAARVFGNYKQGVFPSYDGGISNLYKNNKISASANYSYSKNKTNRYDNYELNFLNDDGSLDEYWNSQVGRNTWSDTHDVNLNFDYFINDNNTFSLSSNLMFTPYFNYTTQDKTKIFDNNWDYLSSFIAKTQSNDNRSNLSFDINYDSKFKNDHKLAFNAHYTDYDYDREQSVNSDYFTSVNSFEYDTAFKNLSDQKIGIMTAQADYIIPGQSDSSSSFTFGVKGSVVDTKSSLQRYDIFNGQDILNASNNFVYNERVFASYANFNKTIGQLTLEGGLRLEHTQIKGTSQEVINDQNYLEWFPTAIISHDLSEQVKLYSSYKRFISRPNYQSLNPFEFYLNDKQIVVGNPDLDPSLNNRVELGLILNNTHTFEVHFSKSTGNINELPIQDNVTNIIRYRPENIGKTSEFGLGYETYLTVFQKLNFIFATELYYVKENTEVKNQTVELYQWSNYSMLSGNMSFLKDNSLSTYFTFIYSSKNLQGLQFSKQQFLSELSISKTILNKRATISLMASDIFNTADFKTSSSYLNQSSSQFINLDNRYIKLGFSYKFGNTTLKKIEIDNSHQERERIKNRD